MMGHTRVGILSIIILLAALPLQGQQLSVLKSDLLIGDQVAMTLSVDSTKHYQQVFFPQLQDSLGKIELIGRAVRSKYSERYTITCFDSGSYNIGPFLITMIDPNGDTIAAKTNQVAIKVGTIDADTTKPYKPIDEIAAEAKPSLITRASIHIDDNKWVYIAAAFLMVLAIVLFWYFRKKRKKESKPTEAPYHKALRLLAELEQQKAWANGQEKAYYVQLSDIVRHYLDERFSLNANELSTRELLSLVKKTGDLRKIHSELRNLLYTSDLVKFAKGLPSEQERVDAAKSARVVVEKTKPEEEVPQRDK